MPKASKLFKKRYKCNVYNDTLQKMHLSLLILSSFLSYLPTNDANGYNRVVAEIRNCSTSINGPRNSTVRVKCKQFELVNFISSVQIDILCPINLEKLGSKTWAWIQMLSE